MADSVRFRFSGGDEFMVDLQRWRDRLLAEVGLAAQTEAQFVAAVVRSQWPVRRTNLKAQPPPGELRRRVQVDRIRGHADAIRFAVRSTAPHSHLLEKPTVPRAYTSRHGARHFTGAMPGQPLFIPTAILHRRQFQETVRRILGSPEPAIGSGTPTVTGSL